MSGGAELVEDAIRIEPFVTSGAAPSSPYPLPLDITQYWVAPSNFGGPVAYVPRVSEERPNDAAIIFTTSTGKFLSHHINQDLLEMNVENTIAMVDWSERQTLIVLFRDGQAMFYHGPTDKKPYVNCLAMLQQGDRVLMGTMGIRTSMLSFVTSNLCLFVSTNIDGEDPDAIAYNELTYLDSTRPPLCMTVLPGTAQSSQPRVVLPCIGMGIIVVEADKDTPNVHTSDAWSDNTIVAMSSHPSLNHICLCTEDLVASVHFLSGGGNNFETIMSVKIDNEVMGNSFCTPKELGWCPRDGGGGGTGSSGGGGGGGDNGSCGDGFMVLSFERPPWCPEGWGLVIVDKTGDVVLRDYSDRIHLVQETDGVRVVCETGGGCEDDELIRALPTSTMNIFSPGSISPGAMLKDAKDALNERDPICESSIQDLKTRDVLDEAVESCIEAAKFERDITLQLSLVKSAAYGARFMLDADDQHDILEDLNELCRDLRVMHTLRNSDIGMSLTCVQYLHLQNERVVARVALWSKHSVALQMCAHLQISGDSIAEHWSCERIKNAGSDVKDEDLYNIIKCKLPGNSNNNTKTTKSGNGNGGGHGSSKDGSAHHEDGSSGSNELVVGSPSKDGIARYRSSGGSDVNKVERALNGLTSGFRKSLARPTTSTTTAATTTTTTTNTALSTSLFSSASAFTTAVPKSYPKASLVPAAQQAMICRRPLLARKLLSLEPILLRQVKALVAFDLLDEALERAHQSSDTDLMYYVLIHCKKGLQWGQFFDLISKHPKMMKLMLNYWSRSNQDTYVLQFFKKTAAHNVAGKHMMQEAMTIDPMEFEERTTLLKMSAKAFALAGNDQACEVVENRIKLEQAQRQLSHTLVGKSLRQTIFDAVRRQEYDLAENLAKSFKLRPRCYLLTKLKALVAAHAWNELDQMSNEKTAQRELDGLYEFFKACFDQGNTQAALQFAIRIKDKAQRLESFIALEIWDEAADMALELRDELAIERIKRLCRDPELRPIVMDKFTNRPKQVKKSGLFGLF